MSQRSEIVSAAMSGVVEFMRTTRGARIVADVHQRKDENSFTVVVREEDGSKFELHFSTLAI